MKVIIYTSPLCGHCKKVKDYLKQKMVEFVEKNVVDDEERKHNRYREEMIDKTGKLSTPTIDIDGEIIIGFKPKEIDAAIKKAEEKK